ncbi:TKL/TKL-ccin protein kinase [Coprinopsis cinerea okayama7|uniref:TKL/TKL-ccin protein kinase n=1 Tax=Coprinopsis cinerea (strain Okayama-7 / 130 / ATCC MYA-4618 / FGSC 9003) TaxID=240176 RepID=A8NII3_COPC7|nr:TKL/TKL-ccin protein kinase [Coprinopsis cinerea okayama7\|eukprot:XP_001834001.2 TKL/TKL-ccin protein kinase [Coprinopsis cinerea okayama7\
MGRVSLQHSPPFTPFPISLSFPIIRVTPPLFQDCSTPKRYPAFSLKFIQRVMSFRASPGGHGPKYLVNERCPPTAGAPDGSPIPFSRDWDHGELSTHAPIVRARPGARGSPKPSTGSSFRSTASSAPIPIPMPTSASNAKLSSTRPSTHTVTSGGGAMVPPTRREHPISSPPRQWNSTADSEATHFAMDYSGQPSSPPVNRGTRILHGSPRKTNSSPPSHTFPNRVVVLGPSTSSHKHHHRPSNTGPGPGLGSSPLLDAGTLYGSQDNLKYHTHRAIFLTKAKDRRGRSVSPGRGKGHLLPESFRPSTTVFDQRKLHPRPWSQLSIHSHIHAHGGTAIAGLEALWCSDNSVPPEQTEVFKQTEDSVKEALKSVTMLSIEVIVKILESGVLEYVPIPGLNGVSKGLVKIWKVVKGVTNNRLRLLRLTQRCAHLLLSIKKDVESAGERVHSSLQNALDALQHAFDKVRLLAESQIETPFLQRLVGGGNIDAEFVQCDEELNEALRMFSLSVQISTMKLVVETSDGLRQQNEELMKMMHGRNLSQSSLGHPQSFKRRGSVNRSPSPNYRLSERRPSTSDSRRSSMAESRSSTPSDLHRSMSLAQSGSIHRPTASSRNKQVIPIAKTVSEPVHHHTPNRGSVARRTSTRRPGSFGSGKEVLGSSPRSRYHPELEDPIEKIKQYQRLQNELDRQSDLNDMKQIIRETLAEGKDSLVIKLLQIDSRDYPQAILVLEHELREYQTGRKGNIAGEGGGSDEREEHAKLQIDLLQRGIDAMKRMTKQEDLANIPEWAINKFKIIELETIGYGSFSTVRRGLWNGRTVAIKILSPKTKRTVFENEMRIWRTLSHPNILPLYGGSNSTEEPLFFVSLYARYGNLVDFLQAIRQNDLDGVFGAMLKERESGRGTGSTLKDSNPVGGARKRYSGGGGVSGSPGTKEMREQAHHNRWQGVERERERSSGISSSTDGTAEPLHTLPLSKSESKFNHCHILKEGDLYGFMVDIAKGMEYLHENGVLHGDLKASNVLVNDDLTCVISDFGQSERRNDIYRASGWTPKGTARWKAPELLTGVEGGLTPAIDVYAYAITCIEILSMGDIPWGSAEDSSLAYRVVVEHLRPPVPEDFRHPHLEELLEQWWHKDPRARPEFKAIVSSLEAVGHHIEAGALDDVRRRMSQSAASLQSVEDVTLPDHSPRSADSASVLTSPFSPTMSVTPPDGGRSYFPVWVASNFNDMHLSPKSQNSGRLLDENSPTTMPTPMLPNRSDGSSWGAILAPRYSQTDHLEMEQSKSPTPPPSSPLPGNEQNFTSSSTLMKASDSRQKSGSMEPFEGDPSGFVKVNYDDFKSPQSLMIPTTTEGEIRDEDLYRLVRHDFHWSLRVPLWNPVLVEVGDVGYMHPRTQTFVTLFNAFEPCYTPTNTAISIPSIMGFGDPLRRHMRIQTQKSKKFFRTFSYKVDVEAGRPMAHCFCEFPDWYYMENTRSPQAWFKASIDEIMELHGEKHNIAKEDVLLVVGSLQASRYSLLISHNHPSGTVEFTGNSGKKGRPWGSFGPISIQGSGSSSERYVTANRVSDSDSSQKALFLAALHFPPDALEPTLK